MSVRWRGDSSIPRRIGARKATRMRGAVANSAAFRRIDASPAAKLSLPDLPAPAPGTLPLRKTLINQPTPRPQIVRMWRRLI